MEQVSKWFLENRRSFPWREKVDPYRVVVSEIMLQQTRAVFVVDYFNRWMERFKTIHDLSKASTEEVVKLWEGLGYYSRARNLLSLAKEVVSKYDGKIPDNEEDLLSLKGIGDYTAGAILAFGFGKKAVALDGNVMRVMSRYLAFDKDVKKFSKEIKNQLFKLLPDEDPKNCMEGLIELGAEICTKKPKCNLCPLKLKCKAFELNLQEVLPILPKRKETLQIHRFVACISKDDEFLVIQRESGEVMGGLYEFPYVECSESFLFSKQVQKIEEAFGFKLELDAPLKKVSHTFTRYKAILYPYMVNCNEKKEIPKHKWINKGELEKLPFSAGHKRILKEILSF
jgi:A/G-specific adenine glycosylase